MAKTPADSGANTSLPIGRFARVCGFPDDPQRRRAVAEYITRLRRLPEFSRKLFAHLAELAYRPHDDARRFGVAYLPELSETSGLGVDEMYAMLQELERAELIRMEGEYPFQDVLIADEPVASWSLMRDLAQFSAAERVPLRDIIVDLRAEVLA
jgi:hypothetical protein